MAETFLSEGWLAQLARKGAELPEVTGADLVLQHEIAGAPDGKVRFFLEWRSGRLVAAQLGKHANPDVVVQAKAPEAIQLLEGRMDPDVAYMQGRLKVDGDYRRLLIDLREWRSSAPYRALWAAMAEITEAT